MTRELNNIIFVLNEYLLEFQTCFNFMYDILALQILLEMSSPPPCLLMMAPKYVYLSTSFK